VERWSDVVIRAVIWKEIREQGLIGLTLVVLGSGVLIAAANLAEPPSETVPASDVVRRIGLGLLATFMLCVTAGMVCGGAVFAAEREAGTMNFLDSLPSSRWRLWYAKLIAGGGLAIAQVVAIVVVGALLELVPSVGWARAIAVYALIAFVWGMFGSTVSHTTLGSIGAAIPGAVLSLLAVLVPIVLYLATFTHEPVVPSLRPRSALFVLAFMFVTPLVFSAWIFTRPDRLRAADDESNSDVIGKPASSRPWNGVRALLWLSGHQIRLVCTVLSGFALLFGLMLLAPGAQPLLTWPGLALAAGVFSGVTAFADEQTRGVDRFWGEQRLPLGRVWMVKVGLHFVMCLGLLIILAAPLILRAQLTERGSIREHSTIAIVFRSPLFDELGRQSWKYLLLPAVYGFAAGHLCGLLFRKLVVACGVAGIVGGVGAVAWGPSLLSGGAAAWQLWLPPALLLLTARTLISGWAIDRLTATPTISRLIGGCTASLLVIALGLGYRVIEIPTRADAEADVAYVATLPPLDSNRGGTGFRTASERHLRVLLSLSPEFDRPATPQPGPTLRKLKIEERLNEVLVKGWPTSDPDLANWLDRMFGPDSDPTSEAWYTSVNSAATFPVGIYEYPQLVGVSGTRDAAIYSAQRMAITLLVRGLQKQAEGNSEEFLTYFRSVVTLAQTMRNGSIIAAYLIGRAIEDNALQALDRWLENLPPQANLIQASLANFPELGAVIAAGFDRPDLIRRAIAILEPLDTTQLFDPSPHFLSERYVIREAMKAPAQWLPHVLGFQEKSPEVQAPEVGLVTLAWAVPWERERTRRLVGLGFETGHQMDYRLITGRPGVGLLIRPRLPAELTEVERNLRAYRRAALLKLALRAYRAEHGHYPEFDRPNPLNILVESGYLRAVPRNVLDDNRTFDYRVGSPNGDTLRPRPRMAGMRIPRAGDTVGAWLLLPGQAMVWCDGPGPQNDASLARQGSDPPDLIQADDIVYIVPSSPIP